MRQKTASFLAADGLLGEKVSVKARVLSAVEAISHLSLRLTLLTSGVATLAAQ